MTNKTAQKITVHLEMEKNTFQVGDTIAVNFFVRNNTTTDFEFCYWQTPLEKKFTANFFEIEYKGEIVPYKGKMVKRRSPTKSDSIIVKSNATITQKIELSNGYTINKEGVYKIRFIGKHINGLPDSEPISFIIKE